MKRYKVELIYVSRYVYEHRKEKTLPVERVKSFLSGYFRNMVEMGTQRLTKLEFFLRSHDAKAAVETALTGFYGVTAKELEEICSIEVSDYVQEEKKEETVVEIEKKTDKKFDWLFDDEEQKKTEKDGGVSASNTEKEENMQALKRNCYHEELEKLVGCDELKKLSAEFEKVAPQIIKNDTKKAFLKQAYIFSVNDGDGLTTYLETFAKLFDVIGIKEMEERRQAAEEIVLPAPEGGKDVLDGYALKSSSFSYTDNHLVCFDISSWIGSLNTLPFENFLKRVERDMGARIVVFRVPYVEKDLLARVEEGIRDVMQVRSVSFPPFDKNQIQKFAVNELGKYGFSATQSAWGVFQDRIVEEKSDGRFYGLNTVQKVVREMLYKKQYNNAYQNKSGLNIGKNDLKGLIKTQDEKSFDGMKALSELIGSEPIVKKVEEILLQIDMARKNPDFGSPCLHMRFVGNPGTGKTTVARILGKILKERGVLRLGNFYEHGGRDFCGRFIGETAPKTSSMCRDAYGSVMFIDEAYTLYRGENNERDFGREALDTLIAEMENHRSDFMVIMAGYTDEMDTLLKGNPGLRNRMPYTIEFPNFTRAQLCEIFRSFLKKKFVYEDELLVAVENYFNGLEEEFINSKDFGNARFVRNLFERTWGKASLRCQLEGKSEIVLTKADFEAASMENDFRFNKKEKHRLGFI